jgi:hypothetical protein
MLGKVETQTVLSEDRFIQLLHTAQGCEREVTDDRENVEWRLELSWYEDENGRDKQR